MKQRALFICSDNGCLSPMAAALANHDFGDRLEAFSAGLAPQKLHPYVVTVMGELGIDISQREPAPLGKFEREPFTFVIALGDEAGEQCPLYFGGVQRQIMNFNSPDLAAAGKEETLTALRSLRDDLRRQLGEFFRQQLSQT